MGKKIMLKGIPFAEDDVCGLIRLDGKQGGIKQVDLDNRNTWKKVEFASPRRDNGSNGPVVSGDDIARAFYSKFWR